MTRLNSIPMNVEQPVVMLPEPEEMTTEPATAEAANPASAAHPASATPEAPKEVENAVSEAKASFTANPLRIELPDVLQEGAPYWARIPPNFVFPRGKQVIFMRFKSDWTDAPWKGEPILDPETGKYEVDAHNKLVLYRQCICWPINTADKRFALSRAQKDPNRAGDEMAKQMIRVVDGQSVDWTMAKADGIEVWWNDMGERCRTILQRVFSQLHILDAAATRDFLQNCIALRATGG